MHHVSIQMGQDAGRIGRDRPSDRRPQEGGRAHERRERARSFRSSCLRSASRAHARIVQEIPQVAVGLNGYFDPTGR